MSFNILVVDDEKNIRSSMKGMLEDEGYYVTVVKDGKECLDILGNEFFPVVFLDVKLPGMSGIEVLERIKADLPFIYILVMSGHATLEMAVEATKKGAYNFFEKPLNPDHILLELKNIKSRLQMELEVKELKQIAGLAEDMIGNSAPIKQLKEQITLAAPSDGRVMIFGENGTGKELVARAIHEYSLRSKEPFIKINCAAIPKDLIESELFGYEKGAFTGAVTRKTGRIEEADKGSLFLDEIGDMSLETQAKLLRVLEESEFVRLGGNKTVKFDIRVISATNKNLEEEIENGNFREDLFYRLSVIPVTVPPLRERDDDIILLVNHFIDLFARRSGKKLKKFDKITLDLLKRFPWPGNVRELKNFVERIFIMIPRDELGIEEIQMLLPGRAGMKQDENEPEPLYREGLSFKEILDEYQRKVLINEFEASGENVSKMAEKLEIDRANLHRKLKKYGIKE